MKRHHWIAYVLAALLVPSMATAQDDAPTLHADELVEFDFEPAEVRLHDVDDDGDLDLLVVGRGGEVRVFHDRDGRLEARPRGVLILPHPARSVLSLVDLLGRGRPQLVVLSPDGVHAYLPNEAGAFSRGPVEVTTRARFPLRVGAPRFVDVTPDVDGDGRPDVLLPTGDRFELWMQRGTPSADKPPRLLRTGAFRVEVRDRRETDGDQLSSQLENALTVPRLDFRDVNGDGRQDLLVASGDVREFFVQAEDGSLPREASVRLDLGIFQDTTPEAEVELGRTLAGGDDRRLEIEDLDGDGILDYVIAHRRKVWVFHGSASGPQFTDPSSVLKVAEDVTAMALLDLDDDERPDLALVRVQVPSLATIIKGLVASWEVQVRTTGYANDGKRSFERTPRWNGDLALELPAIFDVLRDAESIIQRFEKLSAKLDGVSLADLDGDGEDDLVRRTPDGSRIECWRGPARGDVEQYVGDLRGTLRSLFFPDEREVWDLDRILDWLGGTADGLTRQFTGERAADTALERDELLVGDRPPLAADLDGDGRAELILVRDVVTDGGAAGEIELIRLR